MEHTGGPDGSERWERSLAFWSEVLRDLQAMGSKDRRRMESEIRNAREMVARATQHLGVRP